MRRKTFSCAAVVMLWLALTGYGQDNINGVVTLGQPKIWRFDRVAATLDGMLRDIDAVQLASLTALNPNASNQTVIDLLQTYFSIKAKFDAGTAVDNSLKMQQLSLNRDAIASQLSQYNDQRSALEKRKIDLQQKILDTMAHRDQLDPSSSTFAADKQADTQKITGLNDDLTQVTTLETALGNAPTLPTSGVDTSKSAVTPDNLTSGVLKDPAFTSAGLTDVFKSAMQTAPTLPATKQLDNFITLLHERVSRELSVIFDDASRNNRDLYMVQFDIGVRPPANCHSRLLVFKACDDQVLKLQIHVDDGLAYDLYRHELL